MAVRFTTRTKAPVADGNETMPDSVIRIGEAIDLLDANVGWKQVTSGTRPTEPYPGEAIYETDTKRYLVYSAAISNWYKVHGDQKIVVDNQSIGGNLVGASSGVFTQVWSTGNITVADAGLLKIDISAAFFSSANAAGFWRPRLGIDGAAPTDIAGVTSKRFSNGGEAGVMPGGHIHIEQPFNGGTINVAVAMTVDSASNGVTLHVGGSHCRVYI